MITLTTASATPVITIMTITPRNARRRNLNWVLQNERGTEEICGQNQSWSKNLSSAFATPLGS